ncbi:MAG: saccharopine dehydrogenase C-terminal domain-containing protein [Terriglobales bacterium]
MRLLVIGAGMMGSAAAYDMARAPVVEAVTLADSDIGRAKDAAKRVNKLTRGKKVTPKRLDASRESDAAKLMRGHAAALSAVPYFFNVGLARAAVKVGCHFADLGGNNTVVREELAMDKQAAKRGVALAPDCGLSPGMGSILAGELMRRVGGKADALKLYVGGLPQNPKPPFNYQLVFSVEGLINEYVEPARILRNGKLTTIEPLTELEEFEIESFPPLEAFQTSGGTSTLPETFAGKVGECFEKTLRYRGHLGLIRGLYDLGMFSSEKKKFGKCEVAPRAVISRLFEEKFSGDDPDLVILRVEAHQGDRVASFTVVDRFDPSTGMTAMMRTTAWPASVVVQMLASGEVTKRGGILSELDIPAGAFLEAMAQRGVRIEFESQVVSRQS